MMKRFKLFIEKRRFELHTRRVERSLNRLIHDRLYMDLKPMERRRIVKRVLWGGGFKRVRLIEKV